MILKLKARVPGIFILSVLLNYQKCCANPTSGKLDFGDSSSQNPLIILDEKLPPNSMIKQATIIDNLSVPSENSHVISCVTTGCNVTNNANDTDVETVVVLQIKTKVNLDKSDKGCSDNTRDVPVRVGFNSPGLDQTLDDRNKPHFDLDSIRHNSRFPPYDDVHNSPSDFGRRLDYDSNINRYDSRFPPPSNYGFDTRFGQSNNIARPPYAFTNRPNYEIHHPYRNAYGSHNHQDHRDEISQADRRSYHQAPTYPRQDRYDYDIPYNLLRNVMNGFLNQNQGTSEFNINVRSLAPLAVTLTDKDGSNNFKQNGVELRIPHFEPTANKHYFGDDSPPHSLLISKNSIKNPVAFNPVAFKANLDHNKRSYETTSNSNYFGQASHRKFSTTSHNLMHDGHRRHGCPCRDEIMNTDASEKRSVYVDGKLSPISYSDPGEKITGKLDVLN